MKLVIGGAYQGKLDHVLGLNPGATVFRCSADNPELDLKADVIDSLHLLALAQVRAGVNTQDYLEERLEAIAGKTLIADDISSGVVPIDSEMREWREVLGRSLAMLARHADEVTRLFCGIPTRLK